MAPLKNKNKLPAMNTEDNAGHANIFQARNTNSVRIQEDYNTHVSEQIEGKVTKKMSQQ